jgi:hypothetical protein
LESVGEDCINGIYTDKDTFLIDTLDGQVVASPFNRQTRDGSYYDTLRDRYYDVDGNIIYESDEEEIGDIIGDSTEVEKKVINEGSTGNEEEEDDNSPTESQTIEKETETIERDKIPKTNPSASPLSKLIARELNGQYVERRFPKGSAGCFDGENESINFIIYAYIEDPKNNR